MAEAQRTRSLSVAEVLREKLLQGEFAPDSKLQEVALAEDMQVSRTPIREALRALAKDGLLDYAPNRGYTVRRFLLDDIIKAFRVRAVLEGLGCRFLAEAGISEALTEKLAACIAQGDRLLEQNPMANGDFSEWREMNRQFHLAILLETENDLLIRFAGVSRNIPIVFNGSFKWYTEADFRRSQDHHRVIADAMGKGQAERADRMMQEHIYQASEIIRAHFSEVYPQQVN